MCKCMILWRMELSHCAGVHCRLTVCKAHMLGTRRLEDEPVSAFESLNLLDKERRAQRAPPCLETNLPAP